MHKVYVLLVNFIIAFILLKFYSKLQNQELKKLTIFITPIFYTLYRIFTIDMIIEPVRLLITPIFLAIILMISKEKLSWIFLMVSFFITQALWLIVFLMSSITFLIFHLPFDIELSPLLRILIAIPWMLIIFSSIFLLDKHQKIDLSSYGEHLNHPTIRKMIWTIGILVILLYSSIRISDNLSITFDFITSSIILGASAIILLTIITLTVLIIRHLIVEKKKNDQIEEENDLLKKDNLQLVSENDKLNQEYLAIQNRLFELSDVHKELQKDFGDVTSTHHKYKYVVPVLMSMQQKLIEEIQYFSDYTHEEKMNQIINYTDQIKALSFEINDDFIADHISSEIDNLKIPTDRISLISLLEELMRKAHENEVYLSIYNETNLWNCPNIPDTSLIRLVSNLVDNAIKETCKLPEEYRGQVQLIFRDDDEYFCFEVRDFATEFELSILENLGQRKNSTNGTGDGYAEILLDLEEAKASMVMSEWKKRTSCGKSISIIFDGYQMRAIDSHYRQDLLVEKLTGSNLQVRVVH